MDTLSRRLAKGDPAAFAELYDACASRLHHYLWSFLGSKEDAEDVLQETFIRLVRSGKRLAKVENPTAFVFTIARNEALRWGKRLGRAESPNQKALDPEMFEEFQEENFRQAESAEAAALALGRLEQASREIVELKIFAGLTFREIAEVTGAPQGTVASQYRAALEKMKSHLAKDWP
jgi:RNA polymerase sigma-70 factor, ECF subfamily